ncbi:MAG: hypothetical protein CVU49_04245 [Candidatus Cloacimonetes bacterium HGW-Cloacimonetes-2]|jgi:hypothetical protein|nr:MAG: hypothetical protein CVU49_04245 [Candidatus Cloacimonetes bacterium HGW-Cloacimonetes-2]
MNKSVSPCGIVCADCEAYIATQTNDTALFEKLSEAYRLNMGKEISVDDLHCSGCSSEGQKISFCDMCEIRACCRERGYINCSECSEFPCAKGSFIWTDDSKSKAKLEELRALL